MQQRTLVLVKPDGVRRGLIGEVLRRIEAKGYTLVRLELREATPELLAEHYAEHEGKPFYGPLVEFMLSGPVAAVVVEGERVVEGLRSLAGATDPSVAAPRTIRGDLGRDWSRRSDPSPGLVTGLTALLDQRSSAWRHVWADLRA